MSYRKELEAIYTDSYKVQSGDTLNKVALMHGIRPKDLAFVNQVLGETIFPDQILKVPAKKEAPSPTEKPTKLINQKN